MFARMVMMRVNERLGEIYDGFNKPAQKPVQQGQPEAKR